MGEASKKALDAAKERVVELADRGITAFAKVCSCFGPHVEAGGK